MSKSVLGQAIEWANETVKEIKNKMVVGGVYLAIMEIDDRYDIEVEVDDSNIAVVFMGASKLKDEASLEKAREVANEIEAILSKNGVKVFKTREQFEKALEESDV